jgi:hypothetical protein
VAGGVVIFPLAQLGLIVYFYSLVNNHANGEA